jgi:hypothetical protein
MLSSFMNFDEFIFPKVVKIIYWIGLVLIGLGTLASMFGSLMASSAIGGGGGFLGFLFAIIGGIVGVIVWRVMVELWIVLFSILDTLKEIRDQSK